MATQPETIEFVLSKLGCRERFVARPMFGEYALYADGKTVALVCDDQLYVKIMPASEPLSELCETDAPYPRAKPHYVVSEDQLSSIEALPAILCAIAAALPAKGTAKPGKKARAR
jgi:DNA transformation protein